MTSVAAPANAVTRPDIVVVITDDQRYDQMAYLPQSAALLAAEAVQFDQGYVTTPQCCPSRSTFLTGLYSHNTGVLTSGSPNGGAIKFKPNSTLATWLKAAGYRTHLVGKYMNGFKPQKVGPAVPPGWTQFVAFWCTDDDAYYCQLDSNGVIKTPPTGTYSTTQTASIATNYINTTPATTPLFLMWTPFGPHSSIMNSRVAAPKPEFPSDLTPFLGDPPLRPLAFDSLPTPSPAWLAGRPPFTQAGIDSIDDFRRNAQATLQSVDRGIAKIIAALKATGRWQNTLFILWSDNGLSYGEHRISDNKFCPYEECQRVPIWIRIPGGVGRHEAGVVANIDLAPTISAWAGVVPGGAVDGVDLMPMVRGGAVARNCLLLEQLGTGDPKSTYQAVRCGQSKYIEYANGDTELYDLTADPGELSNHAAEPDYAATVGAMASQLQLFQSAGVTVQQGAGGGSGTVTGPGGIACHFSGGGASGNCGTGYIQGSVITLTATPDAGASFAGWSGACSGANLTCTLAFNNFLTVAAAFNPPPPVALSVQGGAAAGRGQVTGPAGLNCTITGAMISGTCSLQFPQGTTVTLTASPGGAEFLGWGGGCAGTTTSCTLTLATAQTVSAGFDDPPVASFTPSCTALACAFNAAASSDDVGIVSYDWDFGDGSSGTGVTASHSYAAEGSYAVVLTVTDGVGLTDRQSEMLVLVIPVNQPPVATFTAQCQALACAFNATGSTDDTGIVTYGWDFGDSTSGTGVAPHHAYAAEGTYAVTLTVTDAEGLTGTHTDPLTVSIPVNQPPVASFTASCAVLSCAFDATGSTDDAGIVAYDWDFGDGSVGTGVSPSHGYAAEGSYTVTLTVTDAEGLAGVHRRTVTVAIPVNQPPVASFTAACTHLACGFNAGASSDDAGIVSYDWDFGDGAVGTGVTPSHGYATDGSYTVTLTVTDAGGLRGTQSLTVTVALPVNQPPVASFAVSCTLLSCGFDAAGSTDDAGIVSYDWDFGDGSAGTGVSPSHGYAIAGSFTVTLTVTDGGGLTGTQTRTVTVTAPVNQPPVASFTAGCTQLACSFNAAASTDDIGIVSYAWTFGDGSTGTGVSPTHSYAAGGSYTVTLTVTDGGGLTGTQSRTVTATAPVNQPPVARFTYSCTTAHTCTLNGSTSTDDVGIVAYTWTFGATGAGGTASGVSITRVYDRAGSYVVHLTVTDTGGLTNKSTKTLSVP